MLPVSVVVLTKNEERNIEACLRTLIGWVGEIFVVDSYSTDGTVELARHYADAVESHPFTSYSDQRNWAQDSLPLQHAWVLHIDADERVTPQLAASITEFFDSHEADRYSGARFARRTEFFGRWIRHGGHYPVYHVRLFRRSLGRCEDRLYDQHFVVDGPVRQLRGDLVDVLMPDLDTWTQRHMRWAAAEAEEMTRRATPTHQVVASLRGDAIARRRWLRTYVFGWSPLFLRAFLYFAYRYIIRLGFLDGTEGLIFHFLQGCWFRFYVDVKVWESRRTAMSATNQPEHRRHTH